VFFSRKVAGAGRAFNECLLHVFGFYTVMLGMSRSGKDSRVRRPSKRTIGEDYVKYVRIAAARGKAPLVEKYTDEKFQKLEAHFNLLSQRYAQDVNRFGCDPIRHFELLELARQHPDCAFFSVRRVEKAEDADYPDISFGSMGDLLIDAAPFVFDGNTPSFVIGTPQSYNDLQVRSFFALCDITYCGLEGSEG
jgi:hypothetical protein